MKQLFTPYELIIIHFGGAKKAYQALGIPRSTFFKWKNKPIPLKHLHTIELASKFVLKRQILVPHKSQDTS
jgi:hypothetical protein